MKIHLLLLLPLIAAGASAAETTAPAATKAPAATTTTVAPAPATAPVAPAATPATAPVRGNGNRRNTAASAASSAEAFENFSLITERNIFNAYRTARRIRDDSAPAPKNDLITLYGTSEDEKGRRAFFDGTDAANRKSVRVGESVDKFKITKIEPKVVELERDGKTLAVNVGQQLRRPEGGDWILTADVQPVQSRGGIMGSMSSRPDPNAAPEITSEMSDAEKRLRARRAEALKKN